MTVADEGGVADQEMRFELVLDGLGRDEFAARGFEQLLFAVGDVEEAVRVEVADVAGGEPASLVEVVGGRRGLLPVAVENIRGPHEQFAVFGDAAFDLRQRLPTEPMR